MCSSPTIKSFHSPIIVHGLAGKTTTGAACIRTQRSEHPIASVRLSAERHLPAQPSCGPRFRAYTPDHLHMV
jgi:hypothetical protein